VIVREEFLNELAERARFAIDKEAWEVAVVAASVRRDAGDVLAGGLVGRGAAMIQNFTCWPDERTAGATTACGTDRPVAFTCRDNEVTCPRCKAELRRRDREHRQ
jgi:hypothetical protein